MPMKQVVLIEASLEDVEEMLRRVVREEIAKPNDILLTAKQAKEIIGISNHQTFHRVVEGYGIRPVGLGKSARYSKRQIEEVVNIRVNGKRRPWPG